MSTSELEHRTTDQRVDQAANVKTDSLALCVKSVSDTGWHWTRCNRPSKFVLAQPGVEPVGLCGIHARYWRAHRPEHIKPLERRS